MTVPDKTIYEYIKDSCIENADLTALYYFGKRISYAELLLKIDEYSNLFYDLGVRKDV